MNTYKAKIFNIMSLGTIQLLVKMQYWVDAFLSEETQEATTPPAGSAGPH